MEENSVFWEETIQPGAAWSHVLKRGTALRLVDLEGGANVGAIFYNFDCPVERYNMPDTLKAQHIARLTKGFVLYSDMGRILCSIVEDKVGWHDPIGGTSNAKLVKARYGSSRYQEQRNDYHKNGRDSFLIEMGKWGLGPRDLTANVNFFTRVDVAEDGSVSFGPDNSKAGDFFRVRYNKLALIVFVFNMSSKIQCFECAKRCSRLYSIG